MDKVSLNYYHTNIVIPNTILANKDFFLNKIIKSPQNMEYFITKDTFDKACKKKKITEKTISCNLTANEANSYFVVYVEFTDDYADCTKAIAIATKGSIVRYFTYEVDNIDNKNCFFVSEWEFADGKIDKHLNYGQTSGCKMTLFAGKVTEILEG